MRLNELILLKKGASVAEDTSMTNMQHVLRLVNCEYSSERSRISLTLILLMWRIW